MSDNPSLTLETAGVVVVGRYSGIELFKASSLSMIECGYFRKYKGLRSPTCGCLPCLRKYAEVQDGRGNPVALIRDNDIKWGVA